MKKSEIVINIMFFLVWSYHKCCKLSQYNEQIHPKIHIPGCTPAYFRPNISNLTLQVIGLCKTQFIPPVIMLQLGKIALFTANHIWTLHNSEHTRNLAIRHQLVSLEKLSL